MSHGVKAQLYIGIEAGANKNYFVSNTEDKPFFDYQPSYGFAIGVPIRYSFPSSVVVWWHPGYSFICTKELPDAKKRFLRTDLSANGQ